MGHWHLSLGSSRTQLQFHDWGDAGAAEPVSTLQVASGLLMSGLMSGRASVATCSTSAATGLPARGLAATTCRKVIKDMGSGGFDLVFDDVPTDSFNRDQEFILSISGRKDFCF